MVFAWYKWGDNYYRDQATYWIRNIADFDIDKYDYLKNSNLWGALKAFNTCYFTPAWFKVYKQFLIDNYNNSHGWGMGTPNKNRVLQILDYVLNADYYSGKDSIYNYYNKLSRTERNMYRMINYINDRNNNTGLFPDWCHIDTKNSIIKTSTVSDRIYWAEKDPITGTWAKYPYAAFLYEKNQRSSRY